MAKISDEFTQAKEPCTSNSLTSEQLMAELQKGFDDISQGCTHSLESVKNEFSKDYGI